MNKADKERLQDAIARAGNYLSGIDQEAWQALSQRRLYALEAMIESAINGIQLELKKALEAVKENLK